MSDVIAELPEVFDERDIAAWFARPNKWLRCDIPAHLITIGARGRSGGAR